MNSKSFLSASLATTALLALAGCSNKEKQLEGKWKLDTAAIAARPGGNQLAQGLARNVNLEFKPDKTFTLNMIFPVSGAWELDGNTVKLTLKNLAGIDMEKAKPDSSVKKDMTAVLGDDGKTLTLQPNDGKFATPFVKDASAG